MSDLGYEFHAAQEIERLTTERDQARAYGEQAFRDSRHNAEVARELREVLQGIREVCDRTGGEFWEGSEPKLSEAMRSHTGGTDGD